MMNSSSFPLSQEDDMQPPKSDGTVNQSAMFHLQKEVILPATFRPDHVLSATGSRIRFDGIVRDHHDGRRVLALEYSAYEELCRSEGQRIVETALEQFPVYRIWAVHRHGPIPIGDCALWVEIESAHSNDGFSACQYIIQKIKQCLPVWKHETYADGSRKWARSPA